MNKKARDDLTTTDVKEEIVKTVKATLKKQVKRYIEEDKCLYKFLQEKKIYGAFVRNIVNEKTKFVVSRKLPPNIGSANFDSFTWSRSKEGWNYWANKNKQYTEFYIAYSEQRAKYMRLD